MGIFLYQRSNLMLDIHRGGFCKKRAAVRIKHIAGVGIEIAVLINRKIKNRKIQLKDQNAYCIYIIRVQMLTQEETLICFEDKQEIAGSIKVWSRGAEQLCCIGKKRIRTVG